MILKRNYNFDIKKYEHGVKTFTHERWNTGKAE